MSATAAYIDTHMLPKILISLALLIMLVIVVGAYFVHRIDSQLARESEAKLKKLEPGVVRGLGMFKKSTFYNEEGLGDVTEILLGWPADREGAALDRCGRSRHRFSRL